MHPEGEEVSETDEARVRRYAQAMYDPHGLGASDFLIRNDRDFWRKTTLAAIAVADEEQAAGWNEAAVEAAGRKAAEADLADARERLRRCEEALATLVDLKDGPRDEAYRAAKDEAWARARGVLGRARD